MVESPSQSQNKLYIIGIGPGAIEHMTLRARSLLESSDYIAGNETYVNQIKGIIKHQKIISSKMGGEVERVKKAVELATRYKVSIISGGDANIYGMAGLVFEIAEKYNPNIEIEVIPGVTAVSSAASLLGAPIVNDFAAISLSDLLTPWDEIERRIVGSASSDFVLALYNPKSRKRSSNFSRTIEIIKAYRGPNTPVGIVKNATREGEKAIATTLDKIMEYEEIIDMSTIVLVGNSETRLWRGKIITPRGYHKKYEY
jgi:precorrin-3B C17-methyltransferase